MHLTTFLVAEVLPLVADRSPEPEDVKAGWTGFGIFLGLAAAVALLGWALTRQLKRTERNRQAGAFGPVPPSEDAGEPGATPAGEIPDVPAADEGHHPGEGTEGDQPRA